MTNEDYIKKILEMHDEHNYDSNSVYLGEGYFIDCDEDLMHICKPKTMYYHLLKQSYYDWTILTLVNEKLEIKEELNKIKKCPKCKSKVPKSILLKLALDAI